MRASSLSSRTPVWILFSRRLVAVAEAKLPFAPSPRSNRSISLSLSGFPGLTHGFEAYFEGAQGSPEGSSYELQRRSGG